MSTQILSFTTEEKYMLIVRSTHQRSQFRHIAMPVVLLGIVPFGQVSVQAELRRQRPGLQAVQGVGNPVQRVQLKSHAIQILGPTPPKVYPQQPSEQTLEQFPQSAVEFQRQALNWPERVHSVQLVETTSQTAQKGLHLVQFVPLGSRKYWTGQGLQQYQPVQQVVPAIQLVQQLARLTHVSQTASQGSQVLVTLLANQLVRVQGLTQVGQRALAVVLRQATQTPEVVHDVQLSISLQHAVHLKSQQTQTLGFKAQPKRVRQVRLHVLLLCQQPSAQLVHWVAAGPQQVRQATLQLCIMIKNSLIPQRAEVLLVSVQKISHWSVWFWMEQTGQDWAYLKQYSLKLLTDPQQSALVLPLAEIGFVLIGLVIVAPSGLLKVIVKQVELWIRGFGPDPHPPPPFPPPPQQFTSIAIIPTQAFIAKQGTLIPGVETEIVVEGLTQPQYFIVPHEAVVAEAPVTVSVPPQSGVESNSFHPSEVLGAQVLPLTIQAASGQLLAQLLLRLALHLVPQTGEQNLLLGATVRVMMVERTRIIYNLTIFVSNQYLPLIFNKFMSQHFSTPLRYKELWIVYKCCYIINGQANVLWVTVFFYFVGFVCCF